MMSPCTVSASQNVVVSDKNFLSLSREPWLEVEEDSIPLLAGCIVEITYHLSYWDEPVRPILRFEKASGSHTDYIAPAPVAGAGIWIGRVPWKTRRLLVSPTDKVGPFGFKIASIRRRHWLGLVARGLIHAPSATRSVVLTRLIGWAQESDNNLSWAVGSTRLCDYAAWRRKRERPLDLTGLDTPRIRWADADPIHVWIGAGSDTVALRRSLDSLRAQLFTRWVAHVMGEIPPELSGDRRLRQEHSFDASGCEGFVTTLLCGDELTPYALATVHEVASRNPASDIFYGDEERIEAVSGRIVPVFKPGWSPILHRQRPFLGRGVFIRAATLRKLSPQLCKYFLFSGKFTPDLSQADNSRVVPIRRVLLRTTAQVEEEGAALSPRAAPAPTVAIIIPTRDQAARLKRLVASIRRHRGDTRIRLIIIDNDSVEFDAKALLYALSRDPDTKVLRQPGAFNFSALCNAGAAVAAAEVLMFLNNDTEVIDGNWLDRLAGWALQDDVGAVGAKLTYPDGRLQHVGVLLGMGGSTGHFESFAHPDAVGWVGRNRVVHEVSAVTGACLAVEARKFWTIGGFDATYLPVELSDIDLCLRLSARGWTSIIDPTVQLVHEESASRGRATFRRLARYEKERGYFTNRWRHVLRGDPYFHPGLSLFDRNVALG